MVSPPMVSIRLHALWSMGHVKERYIQYEKAGDQYLGRVICGLEVNDVSFAVLPPFFDFKERDERADSVYPLLKDYMVCNDHVPASVHCIFYFCFTSLCYHFDYLAKSCTSRTNYGHCISSIIFPTMPEMQLLSSILGAKKTATPTFTGLSPHITILANFEQLKLEMNATRDTILTGVEAELDKRGIGSQSHFDKEEILVRMDELHNELLKKVDICGWSSATALRNIQVGNGISDEFLVSGGGDENFS
jgi:hypothetical protein